MVGLLASKLAGTLHGGIRLAGSPALGGANGVVNQADFPPGHPEVVHASS